MPSTARANASSRPKAILSGSTVVAVVVVLLAAELPMHAEAAPERQRKDLGTWLACAQTCAGGTDAERECSLCLKSALDGDVDTVGSHGLPASYAVDMLSLKMPGNTYTKAWCDSDSTRNCMGGTFVKEDFPGIGTTSYMSWEDVHSQGAEVPQKQNSGAIWRGNELGFIIANPYFWQDVAPKGLVLGATTKQHKVIRPIIDSIFGEVSQARWSKAQVRDSVAEFFKDRAAAGTMDVQADIKAWTHQLLYKIAFGFDKTITFEDALAFVKTQGDLTTFTTISQLFPAEIFGYEELAGTNVKSAIYSALGAESIRDSLKGHFDAYLPLVQEIYGDQVNGKDCHPSPSCAHQLASALLDTFTTAGGLSVPGALSTALGVLYSDDNTNPAKGLAYDRDTQATALFYESMRMFAPVVGFPFWTKQPSPATTEFTCNGAKCTNQYAGGTRKVLNLALAQRDHTKWGSSAEEFKLRGLADYHSNFIGFAEMAERNDVDGGRMNRNCPAKELAVYLGTQFFKQFKKEDWKLSPSQSSIQFGGSTPFVDAFRLYPSATACAYSCTTFDVSCKVAVAKCSTCQTCASYPTCQCNCRWWDGQCHWKCAVCRASQLHCNIC